MKKLATLLIFLITVQITNAQDSRTLPARPEIRQKSDCAAVTQRMMEQLYTVDKQAQVQESPEELACFNYLCAESYEFFPGQAVLRSQRVLFNIEKYKHLRRPDQRITIYDEVSGLKVTLYSWSEVEAALLNIRQHYQLASSEE
jgi:hypothetical protein